MKNRRLARRRLDERLAQFANLGPVPGGGWVRAIRDALGMSVTELARRLSVRAPSVVKLERNEVEDRITLGTLRRAAEALDCQLVYALVPRQSLETIVEEAAVAAAQRELGATFHTMALEDQTPRDADRREMLAELAREIAQSGGKRLWGAP